MITSEQKHEAVLSRADEIRLLNYDIEQVNQFILHERKCGRIIRPHTENYLRQLCGRRRELLDQLDPMVGDAHRIMEA